MKDYLNWQKYNGVKHCVRSDATTNIFEKNIIEARYNWAISRLQKHRFKSVLDVGCGLGYGTNLIFKEGFKALEIDKSKTAIEVCKKRYPFINFIVGYFPQNIKHKYDAIVANEIIEHVPDHKVFIRECFSLLNSNGLLLLSTRNRKYTKNRNPHHIHEFTLEELKSIFPKNKIRALSSHLLRGQRLLLLFMSKASLQRLMLAFSRLPIIHQLPEYSLYFLVEVIKNEKFSI